VANADTSAQPVLAAARFGRRSSRGVLFGLSRLRLATVAGAFVFGASPVWGSALLVAYVPVSRVRLCGRAVMSVRARSLSHG
jgi:hypothetical protein